MLKQNNISEHNGKDYLDVGILKFFSQFYFQLGYGAEKEVKEKMFSYFYHYLSDNFPDYRESWRSVKKKPHLPFFIRSAINIFILKMLIYKKK